MRLGWFKRVHVKSAGAQETRARELRADDGIGDTAEVGGAGAKSDPVTRLPMTTPGTGVIVALTIRGAVDDPARFPRGRDVGAWIGLTPRRWQSARTDIVGRIAKAGDPRVRVMLFAAAASIPGRARVMSPLTAWGLRIARRTSMRTAIVAVSRKRATILPAMWKSGTAYRATGRPPASARDFVAA